MSKSLLATSLLFLSVTGASAQEPGLRVLILSGLNNHDWPTTTPHLRTMFEDCLRFTTVEVTETPESLTAEDFARYDVVVANWTPYPETKRMWPRETEEAFLAYVRGGGGFVVFHAASCSFQEWPDFQRIVGLTWKANHTAHGAYHTFRVRVDSPDHPITRGLSDFYTTDELYHNMVRLTDAPMEVLCQAFSDRDEGGTGEDEPMLITTRFGEGRGVNTMLGHDVRAMGPGFRGIILRSAEWAATGEVTIAPPEPWPSTPALAKAGNINAETAITQAGYYAHGNDRAPLEQVRLLVAGATSLPPGTGQAYRRELAEQLSLGIDRAQSVRGKTFLQGILARLAPGTETAHARKSNTPDDLLAEAESASRGAHPADALPLLDALSASDQPGPVRAAALRVRAQTWPEQAPLLLAQALEGNDSALHAMALYLARELPGKETTLALSGCIPGLPGELATLLIGALADRGDGAALTAIETAAASGEEQVRVAALAALGTLGGEAHVPLLLTAVRDDSEAIRAAACAALAEVRGTTVSETIAEALPGFPPEPRELLMGVLEDRHQTSEALRDVLMAQTQESGDDVRAAAWRALGILAAEDTAGPMLIALAANEALMADTTESALLSALTKLDRSEQSRVVLAVLHDSLERNPGVAVLCVRLAHHLGDDSALPVLREAAAGGNPGIRGAVVKALCDWPTPAALPQLLALAQEPRSADERKAALQAVSRLAAHPDSEKQALGNVLRKTFELAQTAEERRTVLQTLALSPSPVSLALALDSLGDNDVGNAAATAALSIARKLSASDPALARSAAERVGAATVDAAIREAAWALLLDPAQNENLARRATADSPDGIEPDGAAGGDSAANDGDPESYWDEQDNHPGPYRLRLTFPEPTSVRALRVVAHWHEDYKPRDYDLLCDGVVVKTVTAAEYGPDHAMALYFPPQECTTLELLIRRSEGLVSPCIHELEVYNVAPPVTGQTMGETH